MTAPASILAACILLVAITFAANRILTRFAEDEETSPSTGADMLNEARRWAAAGIGFATIAAIAAYQVIAQVLK